MDTKNSAKVTGIQGVAFKKSRSAHVAFAATLILAVAAAREAPAVEVAAGVSLKISAAAKKLVSGHAYSLDITLVNRSGLPLWFVNPRAVDRFFAITSGSSAVGLTRYGRSVIGSLRNGGGPTSP